MADFYADNQQRQIQQGLEQHKDTTATAENILKIAEEARQTGAETLAQLDEQGQQLKRIQQEGDEIHANVKIADNFANSLGWMGWLNCCTGADQANAKAFEKQKKLEKQRDDDERRKLDEEEIDENQTDVNAAGGRRKKPPRSRVGMLDGPVQQELDEETAKQDAILDQVGVVVDELKNQANQIGQTIDEQDDDLNRLADGLENTQDRLGSVRKKISQYA